MGFSGMDPKSVQQMDAVDHIDDLLKIGRQVGLSVQREHFGSFL